MNKQEVISKLKSAIPKNNIDDYQRGEAAGLNFALLLLAELDELKRPAVPRYVADFYESIKDDFEGGVYELCAQFYEEESELSDGLYWWFKHDDNKPIETLVKMKLYGYDVEKEKLYTVELPNPNAGGHVVLCKTSDGIVSITFASIARWRGGKNVQLTEAEIKKDFEWAWQFAEEVEE